jgi:hypothetical protein
VEAVAPVVEAVVAPVDEVAAPVVELLEPIVQAVQPANGAVEPIAAQGTSSGTGSSPAAAAAPLSPSEPPQPVVPSGHGAAPASATAGQAPARPLAPPYLTLNDQVEPAVRVAVGATVSAPSIFSPIAPEADSGRPTPFSPLGHSVREGLSFVAGSGVAPVLFGIACATLLLLVAPQLARRLAVAEVRPPREGFSALLERPG